MDWRLLVEEPNVNIGVPLDMFGFCCYNDSLRFEIFQVLGSLRTSLLCILEELAGGGSVAMAVGITDICQVIGDT